MMPLLKNTELFPLAIKLFSNGSLEELFVYQNFCLTEEIHNLTQFKYSWSRFQKKQGSQNIWK